MQMSKLRCKSHELNIYVQQPDYISNVTHQ